MSRVQLCNGTSWVSSIGGDLGLWDAGTDSGMTLTAANEATVPPTATDEQAWARGSYVEGDRIREGGGERRRGEKNRSEIDGGGGR